MSNKNTRAGLWILLAMGALLILAAALGAEEAGFTVKRTDRFNATLSPGSTLRIENVSGNISVTPGQEFSAVVTVSAAADSKEKAEELLRATTVLQERGRNEFSLRAVWPDSKRSSKSSGHIFMDYRYGKRRCDDCRISARYEVTVPAGVRAIFHTVNGDVRAEGCDADLELNSVNGKILVSGGRRGLVAGSVNGKVDVAMQSFPPSAELQARTVNGSVLVTLPKESKFELSASTMNGTISSTFPLPAQRQEAVTEEPSRKTPRPGAERDRTQKRIVVRRDGDDTEVDVEALRKEVEESLKQVDVEVRESLREYNRELRRIKLPFAHRAYDGSVGQGGGKVRISTLNGSIAVLAAGSRQSDAKPLVPESRGFAVTIPEIHVHARPVVVPATPRVLVVPHETEESVVRGNISGDFLATSGGGTYTIGRVSGTVKILTRSGEIHVASAGAGADLKTWGGDIQIGPVTGELKARTMAGDIQAGSVTGSVALDTAGGDIRAEAVGGSASARTGGGDITLPLVKGPVEARTSGGDVNVGIIAREIKSGITIHDGGGDVTLTLPADFRGEVDLQVHETEGDETFIHSDFPEVALTRQRNWQRASGVLNGGGPRIVVQTHSGSIQLRKGPAAGN